MGKKSKPVGFFSFEIDLGAGPGSSEPRPLADWGRALRPYVRKVDDLEASNYALSKAFAPPRVNLRQGEIADAYGDESYCTRLIRHVLPQDPTEEDFRFYSNCYPYMERTDLLYYFYSVCRSISTPELDGYFYTLSRNLPELIEVINEEQRLHLFCGLLALWTEDWAQTLDWMGCPELLKFLGVQVEQQISVELLKDYASASCRV